MTVMVLGGLDRLKPHYAQAGKELGVQAVVCSQCVRRLADKLRSADAVLLLTDQISHAGARQVQRLEKQEGLCVLRSHSSSLSSVRRCFERLKAEQRESRP